MRSTHVCAILPFGLYLLVSPLGCAKAPSDSAISAQTQNAPTLTSDAQTALNELATLRVVAERYAQAHDGTMPDTANDLAGAYIPARMLTASDGQPYWLDFKGMDSLDFDRVVGFDQGAWERSEYVPVLFADGHTELLHPLRLRRFIEMQSTAQAPLDSISPNHASASAAKAAPHPRP